MSIAPVTQLLSALWTMTLGDERIRIAVLDGPVDRTHGAFKRARLSAIETSFSTPGASQGFASEHGTHVASLIFGQHDGPIKGIAPQCSGLLIPIFGNSRSGAVLRCSQVDLANAITAAVNLGAHIVNISGGEFTSSGRAHPILGDVLERCDRQGVLIVAAAGNDGCDCLHIPAAHPSILAVGAATTAGEPLESSNFGNQYQGHGILAPGENLRGALPGGRIGERSGTSSATAIVSGVAGLLMSLEVKDGVAPSGPRIRQFLLESSDACPHMLPSTCQRYLSGVLNLERALSLISKKDIEMSLNEPNTPLQANVANQPTGIGRSDYLPAGPNECSSSATTRVPSFVSPSMTEMAPSGCACDDGTPHSPQFVFAIGQIGIGFSSQARFDSLWQHMFDKDTNPSPNPYDVTQLFNYLENHKWDATSVIWTLEIESVPVYAISVGGPNSGYIVENLRDFLVGQAKYQAALTKRAPLTQDDLTKEDVERVSIAGVLRGQIRLMTGAQLPVIHPEVRGMCGWNSPTFAATAAHMEAPGREAPSGPKLKQRLESKKEVIQQFLERICFDFRNLGLMARDRAINYVAANPYGFAQAFTEAAEEQMQLHTIEVTPSRVCRVGSDCWDVRLEYFVPTQNTAAARRVYRVTVDVSDVVPVTVGRTLYWPSAD